MSGPLGAARQTAMLVIRDAAPPDVPLIRALIGELAAYERLTHALCATEEDIRRALFGAERCARALIAEWGGEPAGFALYFFNFSTFLGRPGLYLEDLFVRPAQRGRGIGKGLLVELARRARAAGCGRMEWAVLDWNEPAIGFYRSLGAKAMDGWTVYRLEGREIEALAAAGDE